MNSEVTILMGQPVTLLYYIKITCYDLNLWVAVLTSLLLSSLILGFFDGVTTVCFVFAVLGRPL